MNTTMKRVRSPEAGSPSDKLKQVRKRKKTLNLDEATKVIQCTQEVESGDITQSKDPGEPPKEVRGKSKKLKVGGESQLEKSREKDS